MVKLELESRQYDSRIHTLNHSSKTLTSASCPNRMTYTPEPRNVKKCQATWLVVSAGHVTYSTLWDDTEDWPHKKLNENEHSFFFKDFIDLFLERGMEGERGKETSMCGCLSHAPYWGLGPQPRHVPYTGNQTSDPLVCKPVFRPLSHSIQGENDHSFSLM